MRFLLVMLFCGNATMLCAQQSPVRRAYAFAQRRISGKERRDLDANRTGASVETLYFLYLVTVTKEPPVLDGAESGRQRFLSQVTPTDVHEVLPGRLLANARPVRITRRSAEHLWLIELTRSTGDGTRGYPKRLLIRGHIGREPFSMRLAVSELEPVQGL